MLALLLAFLLPLCSSSEQPRIIGGAEVRPHSIPYQISFQGPEGGHFCGGSVIDANTVLTAGQCCAPAFPGTIVVAGKHNLDLDESEQQVRVVKELISHPQFDLQTFAYDACILKLEQPLVLNEVVKPIKLPAKNQIFAGNALVSGWGITESGSTSTVLREVSVPLVDDEICVSAYESFGLQVLAEVMICAGTAGKDACAGDSGGPLVCDNEIQCGIVSWAKGCALAGFPGVYTEIAVIVDFIEGHMG